MRLKECSKCGIVKTDEEFDKDGSKNDGLYSSCKSCRSIASKQHYAKHSDKYKKKRQESMDYVYDILSDSCCSNCGETDIVLLDFDHRDPKDKRANISQMVGWSKEAIDEEIAKCDILCSHCHRYRTAHQFGWYVLEYLEKRRKKIKIVIDK